MRPKNITWNWRSAIFGTVVSVIPAAVIISGHVADGLHLFIGSLLAAIAGLAPSRHGRLKIILVGVLFGVFVMLGSFLAQWAVVAVIGIFVLAVLSTSLAAQKPVGMVVLTLGLPLAAIGFSYAGLKNSVGLGLLVMAGSILAYLWALLFPEYPAASRRSSTLLPRSAVKSYGIRLGLAAATGSAIGFAIGTDHVGWISGATLFVMRPSKQMQELRSVGRVISVLVGALLASALLAANLSDPMIALVAALALITAAATNASRWYVTPAFSTFLVFWALLYGNATAGNIKYRFWQRVLETLLGVTIAYCFGLLIPKLMSSRQSPNEKK